MKVLTVSADRLEECELRAPRYRLREDGITVDIAAPARGAGTSGGRTRVGSG